MQKLVIPRPGVWYFLKGVEKYNYQASWYGPPTATWPLDPTTFVRYTDLILCHDVYFIFFLFLFFFLQPRADAAPDVGDADDWQLHNNSAFITIWRTLQISLRCSGKEQSYSNCSLDFFFLLYVWLSRHIQEDLIFTPYKRIRSVVIIHMQI